MADTLASVNVALKRLEIAFGRIQRDAVRAVQAQAQPARRDISQAWALEQFYSFAGSRVPIRPYGARWSRIKRRFGYSMLKGTATGGVQRVLNKPSAVRKTPKGFVIDFGAAAIGANTRYRNRAMGKRGKFKRPPLRVVPVVSYIYHMARAKAPGLGSISKVRQGSISRAVQTAIDKRILAVSQSISKAAGLKGGYRLQATFDLQIGRIL